MLRALGVVCLTLVAAACGDDAALRKNNEGCRSDSECEAGKWCVPCQASGTASVDGDCIAPSQLRGAVAEVCKMLHPSELE